VLLLDNVISATGQPPTVEFLVTDGTNAGTMTFTIPGPPPPLNFNPGPFKSFGNLVLFSATDYSGLTSLWVSDGTGTGTKPLSVSGANTTPSNGGLHPIDLTVLGNKVLFNGSDNAGFEGLWVTDGTAAGTHELVQSQRIGVSGPVSLDPQDITIAGGKAFFSGGFSSLWVTDGTAAGTQELFVSGTLNSQGLPDPSNLTVFDNKSCLLASAATPVCLSVTGPPWDPLALPGQGPNRTGLRPWAIRSCLRLQIPSANRVSGSQMEHRQGQAKFSCLMPTSMVFSLVLLSTLEMS
jgi:ELWxxDGT repeat protein